MQPNQEPGGDYGYDLAHTDVQRTPPPAERPAPEPPCQPPGGGAPGEGEDLAYDEAHGF